MGAATITAESHTRPAAEPRVLDQSNWHALEPHDVTLLLDVDPKIGLTPSQVSERQLRYGRNALQRIQSRSAWRVRWMPCGQSRTHSRVRRDGFESTVEAEELVPGDIVILTAGDRMPADARLLEAVRLEVEESALTGESTTVEKGIDRVPEQTTLAERRSMLYLGTAVAAGRAVGIVVSTGTATELGKVGRLVATSIKERSPLEIQLAQLGRRLVYLVLAIAAVVMVTGWLRHDGFWLMVEIAISLAVAAVPEGLPAVTTLILALGVLRMAQQ